MRRWWPLAPRRRPGTSSPRRCTGSPRSSRTASAASRPLAFAKSGPRVGNCGSTGVRSSCAARWTAPFSRGRVIRRRTWRAGGGCSRWSGRTGSTMCATIPGVPRRRPSSPPTSSVCTCRSRRESGRTTPRRSVTVSRSTPGSRPSRSACCGPTATILRSSSSAPATSRAGRGIRPGSRAGWSGARRAIPTGSTLPGPVGPRCRRAISTVGPNRASRAGARA